MQKTISCQESHKKISRYIESSRFYEAFDAIKREASVFASMNKEIDRISKLEEAYKYMLHYVSEGFEDNNKDSLILNIKETLRKTNDLILRNSLLIDSPELYYSTKRMEQLRQNSVGALFKSFLEINPQEDSSESQNSHRPDGDLEAIKNFFNYVWTMFGAQDDEYQELSDILINPQISRALKASILSALFLGNISFFDDKAFNLLLDVYENQEDPLIKSRSVVAVVILTLLHSKRISENLEIKSRLTLMKENPEMKSNVKEVIGNLLRAFDTKRVTSKMKEEVIPGLMKIRPDIIEKMRNMSLDSENFLSDANPDWEEIIESSGIGDKLQELNDLQMEGADVMMTTFSNLKGFPFFYQINNWFLPFLPEHPEFENQSGIADDDTLSRLDFVMCDSDLYSFLLSLKGLPETQRSMMFNRLENQMKEAEKILKPEFADNRKLEMSRNLKHYIQDLYRFFKLFRKKNEFNDPFEQPLNAENLNLVSDLLGIEKETLKLSADFFFKYGYWQAAADFLEIQDQAEAGTSGIWEKIGYCYQKLAIYDKAIEWYKKAELMNPESQWLDKNLAICLRKSGKSLESLEYFERSLARDPENFHLLMSAGQALLDSGNYSKALEHFYHAGYLKPSHKGANRAIAWGELLNGNIEKAEKQYQKLLANPDRDKEDLLNAGHVSMKKGDYKNAVSHYSKFIDATESKSINELIIALRDDSAVLKELNIKTPDLRLVVDKIRYDMKGN
ncbi:MAG: tetratricopeptide repeat protein [Muribaculaceae bacterium]|nr:tetratricopeptide repeat protein [Muribaculaceae bacterium]